MNIHGDKVEGKIMVDLAPGKNILGSYFIFLSQYQISANRGCDLSFVDETSFESLHPELRGVKHEK